MSNRMTTQFRGSLVKSVVDVFLKVSFGASGDPTIVSPLGKGVVSIVKDATGRYTIKFGTNASMLDTYPYFLGLSVVFDETSNSGTAPLAPLYFVRANASSTVNVATIQVQFLNTSGSATDPAANEIANFNFVFGNSTAP